MNEADTLVSTIDSHIADAAARGVKLASLVVGHGLFDILRAKLPDSELTRQRRFRRPLWAFRGKLPIEVDATWGWQWQLRRADGDFFQTHLEPRPFA